jgi:hypothetical protein
VQGVLITRRIVGAVLPPLALAPLCALAALVPVLRAGAGIGEAAGVYVAWVLVTLPLLLLARGGLLAVREAQRAYPFLFVAPTMAASLLAFALAAVASQPLGAWIHGHTHQRALGAVTWTVATAVLGVGAFPLCRRLSSVWPKFAGGLAFVAAVTLVLRGALRDGAWFQVGVLAAGALLWDAPMLRRDGPRRGARVTACSLGALLAVVGGALWWIPLDGLKGSRLAAAELLRSLLPLACAPVG